MKTLRIAVGPPNSDDVKVVQTLTQSFAHSHVRLRPTQTDGASTRSRSRSISAGTSSGNGERCARPAPTRSGRRYGHRRSSSATRASCVPDTSPCPTCGAPVQRWERYPNLLCVRCAALARDEQGRPTRFMNTTFLAAGFRAEVADAGTWRLVDDATVQATCW